MASPARNEKPRARACGSGFGEPQLGIGRPHARFGQAELAADDVGPLDQGDALVERDAPRQGTASRRPAAAPNLKEKNSPSLGSLQAHDAVAA